MQRKGLTAFMFFLRKQNTNALRQVSWLGPVYFAFPSSMTVAY
jgi:hypothetical protein